MPEPKISRYGSPAGGWGSLKSIARHLWRDNVSPGEAAQLARQNKPDGFACVSCAWAKPANPHIAEFCENGAKATIWERTASRADGAFFDAHTVRDLRSWSDFDLERAGRLTQPRRYDRASDKYLPTSWEDATREIGTKLLATDPKACVFYASGRASLETSYMYALFARLYGHNNLPDSSNMCHEPTSVALPQSIGVPVGTVRLEDFAATDLILFFGQNVGSNAPRMLHELQTARQRGAEIITFNPLRERGLERFINPQSPAQMLTGLATEISTQYHQVRAGGDLAAITGVCKALFDIDLRDGRFLDSAFIAQHTAGFEALRAFCTGTPWANIESRSGLSQDALRGVAEVYARAKSTIAIYGMGITQHRRGAETINMLVALLLLRGNMGRPGAGICPVRGHSNVQGQRTVGITEKPELVPLDKLSELYGFEPPRDKGLNTVEACEGVLDGSVRAFLGLGGNFLRAVPDTARMEAAWPKLDLTVHIATKLNRSHLFPGEASFLLPCLGRLERDDQQSGRQYMSVEDSTSRFHASLGNASVVSALARSEPWIVAEIAKATLPDNRLVPWDEWVGDYAKVRDAIERTYPDKFKNFNAEFRKPGGLSKPLAARERVWETKNRKANFIVPKSIEMDPDITHNASTLNLMTLRSNDQFNTTVYGYDDRFRGVSGTRMVLFMNDDDMRRIGVADGETVTIETVSDDDIVRRVPGLRVVRYDIPRGDCAGYYPELNVLLPLQHHEEQSKTPAAKSIPIRVVV
ncbi:formate dehydrogenase H [Variibacter gotjawalensis]|uniref:Formate dehydrogenase H n=1 Tax=Variibacter gotjawalensis TaxID=1333996 RepID=A0A0S3PRJ3_9BRAD|nr:FdhF/YdeP family oxidoreductase [Variibacter gotjawalensis]NIK48874.1 molybdopterin-dependent oxidoreductase alpha subunit [Variibacter gotjawalensis]RZS50731.1 molybdopterin-dependent oxidoreductase alpha subunit [Variibacter gotjawalensis]BAT58567.1 formate dehydrogenase H [Variibacter gotjawalensis]